MGIDLSALTTNADKLDKHIDKNDKQEQDKKNEQLYGAIERKVTKEKHKCERPRGRDGTIKECKKLFKEGASPEVLTKLEKSLRGQKEYHRYYVQCFLPVLKRKISKELEPIKREEIEKIISSIIGESVNHNHYSRKDSQDSGIGSDNDDERQTDNRNVNDRLLEAAKRGNKTKIKKRVQEGADISSKDGKGNNALHYISALPRGKQRVACLNLILSFMKKEEISKDKLSEAINPEKGQTLIQKLLFNKITKEEHSSESVSGKIGKFLKRPFTEYDDNTIEAAIKLFELGANIDDLQLSKEELQNLDREHERYYLKFLEKLAKSIKKPELKQEIKTQIKRIIAYTINTPDSNDNYLLHLAINNYDKGLFQELLQKGADINLKDANGDNALHHIASLKGEQKVTCLNLILDLAKERKIVKDQLGKAVNSKNQEGQIPLHQLLQHIKRKNEDQSCTDRKFEETKRYETLKLLLQNGADITAQDKEGKNALHHIALLKGEQKVACLDLIVKEGNMPGISKAVNAKNGKKQTPLQVALIAKMVKNKHSKVNFISRDNTIKFCVKLLQNRADPKQLILPESLWSREYYKTIRGIEKSMGKLLIPDDMRTELKLNFGKKFKARDIMKYVNSVVCKVVTTLVFVAITCAVVFSAAQGSITIATASSLIAAIGVCYLIYLNLENIYEGFKKLKGKFTGEKQPTLRDDVSKNDTQCNDSSKSMENKPNGLEEQKAQDQSKYTESSPSSENDRNSETQKSSDQPEHKNPPNSRMSDTHSEPHKKLHERIA